MSIASLLLAGRSDRTANPVRELTNSISAITANGSMNNQQLGGLAFATESMGDSEATMLINAGNSIEATIKQIGTDLNLSLEAHQIAAATIAGITATNPKAALNAKLKSIGGDVGINSGVADGNMDRSGVLAFEAYNENDNRTAQTNSIVFNLLASRQDDFCETFFPTIVINPSEVGIVVQLKLYYAYNDFKRSANGALADYGRMSLIRAYRDPSILKNELTRCIPVIRTSGSDKNDDQFVAGVSPWTVNLGTGVKVTTAPLKVDTRIDLLGITQTNELLNSGLMGPTDSLDTNIKLEKVYVKVTSGTDVEFIAIDVSEIPSALFTYAPQGNNRRMILVMDTDAIVMGKHTKTLAGTAPTLLPELADNDVRLRLGISGSAVLDKGDTTVSRGSLELSVMRNTAGQLVQGSVFTSFAAKVKNIEVVGYDIFASRANINHRQRGQLLDSQTEDRVINVPYRSPIAVLIPTSAADNDSDKVHQLINATGMRITNEGITALLRFQTTLASYRAVEDSAGGIPEMSALGHNHVRPVYFADDVVLPDSVDSLKSHERLKDIRAALVEQIRYYANEMYLQSEYKAAAAVLTGNAAFKPTIIIGTDLVTYNYLCADGDLRMLGDSFDVKLVSTLDERVDGKIFISFGVFDTTRNTAVNPLNFGNMLYSPEVTTKLQISRNDQTSVELVVAPRFLHFPVLPVMTVLNVSGLASVVGKVTQNHKAIV